MKKVRFGALEAGQEFAYRGNYFIKDADDCDVQLTGKGAGCLNRLDNDIMVCPVTLLVEEE